LDKGTGLLLIHYFNKQKAKRFGLVQIKIVMAQETENKSEHKKRGPMAQETVMVIYF